MTVAKDPGHIRRMFAEISPRYDLLNHVLSLNIDRRWRRRAARALNLPAGGRVLDLCTGTGDLALAIDRHATSRGARVVGSDFTAEMVRLAETKRSRRKAANVSFVVADSLTLPFADRVFDAVTVAFGIRNVADLEQGLREMRRVLKPSGQAAVLEFSPPRRGALRRAFEIYFRRVLPAVGRWVSGSEAYGYLPRSVVEFPPIESFTAMLSAAGFEDVRSVPLTLGVAVLHLARRPAPDAAGGRE